MKHYYRKTSNSFIRAVCALCYAYYMSFMKRAIAYCNVTFLRVRKNKISKQKEVVKNKCRNTAWGCQTPRGDETRRMSLKLKLLYSGENKYLSSQSVNASNTFSFSLPSSDHKKKHIYKYTCFIRSSIHFL